MKKKRVFLFLAVGLLAIIVLGSTLTQGSTEVSGDDYDTAFYVDGSKNVFIMTAKMLDKFCFYVIDVVISSVGSVFSSILNN
ncbi:MAG: hypothetical protein K2K48_06030 [Anaeroplasmataceae bacterium]|nr:hypothetical protein [Anaeroplasmataceae bacterium]MDE6414954.1 hypothetical protein [Anaeroplasmataceae bacterium]